MTAKIIRIADYKKQKETSEAFDDKLQELIQAVMRVELAKAWPDWEASFYEAVLNEQEIGPERALEILRRRCPLELKNG